MIMRKFCLFFILLILFLMPISLFAAETWYEPKKISFIDLGDENNIYTGVNSSGPVWNVGYFENDLIGLIGIVDRDGALDSNKKYIIKFNFIGNDWTFKSASASSWQIPFGIQLVARYGNDETYYGSSGDGVLRFGYQEGYTVPIDSASESLEIKVSDLSGSPKAIWMDIILVLPESPRQLFDIGIANDYSASISFSIEEQTLDSLGQNIGEPQKIADYMFNMSGYYGTNDEQQSNLTGATFVVFPGAKSYKLEINELIDAGESGVEIGKYYYAGDMAKNESVKPGWDNITVENYKLFASSSSSPTATNDTPFIMKHTEAINAELNNRNGFYFQVGLNSNADNYRGSSDRIKWYDGTGDTGDSDLEYITSGIDIEQNKDNIWLYSFYDEGSILIRYPSSSGYKFNNADRNLVSGVYNSIIYIHLICEE